MMLKIQGWLTESGAELRVHYDAQEREFRAALYRGIQLRFVSHDAGCSRATGQQRGCTPCSPLSAPPLYRVTSEEGTDLGTYDGGIDLLKKHAKVISKLEPGVTAAIKVKLDDLEMKPGITER